jgi:hypothetical protein
MAPFGGYFRYPSVHKPTRKEAKRPAAEYLPNADVTHHPSSPTPQISRQCQQSNAKTKLYAGQIRIVVFRHVHDEYPSYEYGSSLAEPLTKLVRIAEAVLKT